MPQYLPDYSYLNGLHEPMKTQVIRELCKRDLYFLCKHVLGYKDMETATDIHIELCRRLNEDPHRFCYAIFRGAFKTSIALAKVIQWLICHPEWQIGIGSDLKQRAVLRTRDLQSLIENSKKLKTLFPDVFFQNPKRQSSLWRQEEFDIRRPSRDEHGGFRMPSVSAFGLDPLPTGAHFDAVLIDDPENEQNQYNDEQIQKIIRHIELFIPILKPEAPVIMDGTYYSTKGPIVTFMRRWPSYRVPIVDRNGLPQFPKKFPKKVIDQLRKDITDEWVWKGQYMMEPADPEDDLFFPFRHVPIKRFTLVEDIILLPTETVMLKDCLVYVTVDPSGGVSKEQATAKTDKVGVIVNATDTRGRWFVLDWVEEYYTDDQFIELLYQLYARWRYYIVGIEKLPHLMPYIRTKFQQRGRSLPLVELKHRSRTKEQRIRGLSSYFENTFFNVQLDIDRKITTWHTTQEHGDDGLDALAYQIDIALPPSREQLEQRKRQLIEFEREEAMARLSEREQREWTEIYQYDTDAKYPTNVILNDLRDMYRG